MTKEDYMRLPKERLAELLAERDSLEETIEDKIAEKIAEILSKQPLQLPQQPSNPYQPIPVLYGCPSDLLTAYVVTRSEEHDDYVEQVFFDEEKANEYCELFNNNENSYHRNVTKIEVSL